MFTGVSSATRASHQRAISSACSLVSDGGEAAAGVAGAGDEAGADRARLGREAERLDRGLGERDLVVRHAGDQQVLPDGEADIAVAEIAARSSRARASASPVILPTGSTTPIQFSPSCFCACTPICAARSNAGRGCDALRPATRASFAAELLLDQREEFLEAPGVEHVFQPRLVAVGAVAVVDEHAHDGVGDLASRRRASRSRRCRARNPGGR